MQALKLIKSLFIFVVLAPVFLGCSSTGGSRYNEGPGGEISPQPGGFVFPHINDWADPEMHGRYVTDSGSEGCISSCHGEDLSGGTARGCKSCHVFYPHDSASTWQGLTGHGRFVRVNGLSACTTACHGASLDGGYDPENKKACSKCHESYPSAHGASDWDSAGHANLLKNTNDSAECVTMCHRTDAPADLVLKSCSSCHLSYPDEHNRGGNIGGSHAEFLEKYGGVELAGCTTCHGARLEGGSSNTPCLSSSCHHIGEGEGTEWNNKEAHGAAARENISRCIKCHGDDLKGTGVVDGCDNCHHKNWEDEHGIPWRDISQHGVYGVQPATSCKICHSNDLTGGVSGIDCRPCHSEIYPHAEGWAGGDHAVVAGSSLNECANCHGGVTSDDCKTCHHDNNDNWENLDHQSSAAGNLSGCRVCHGNNLDGGESDKSCFDCHDPGNVLSLHDNADWAEENAHGQSYIDNGASCVGACHGANLAGGISERSCIGCHTGYPHADNMLGTHGAGVLTESDDFDQAGFTDKCAPCHGGTIIHGMDQPLPEPTGVLNNIDSCYSCHSTYPHIRFQDTVPILGNVNLEWQFGHGNYVTFNSIYTDADIGEALEIISSVDDGCAGDDTGCHTTLRHGSDRGYGTLCEAFCH